MKRIYTLAVLVALSACSSQKYSNTKYQENNNTDDAYFSPSDAKVSAKKTRDANVEKYKSDNASYYENTQNETANPNAAQRNTNYSQYSAPTNGSNTTTNNSTLNNSIALQGQTQRNTLNMYNQPNWGTGFTYSPFSPWLAPGIGFSYSSWGRNSWYVGPTNPYGLGWNYNPWYGWTYSPYAWNTWNNGWGCSPLYNPYSGYSPWGYNNWAYDPWGWNNPYNYYGYNNGWFNPYYNPYNNYWGNGWNYNNNPSNTRTVRNERRRPDNTFTPAVRTPNTSNPTTNGGSRVVGSTERQASAPATGYTDPIQNNSTPASSSNTSPATTNTTPTRNPSGYYNYTPAPSGTAGTSAPTQGTSTTPSSPSNRNTGGTTNYNPNAGSAGTQTNGGSTYTPPTRNSNYQQPQNSTYTPPPTQQRAQPTNNGGGGRSNAPGSGGSSGGNSGGGRRR